MNEFILQSDSLIARAVLAGKCGKLTEYPGGFIAEEMFTFLGGKADKAQLDAMQQSGIPHYYVCLSENWATLLLEVLTEKRTVKRWMMQPRNHFTFPELPKLPEEYDCGLFTEDDFEKHPFEHGVMYPNFEDFHASGSGACVHFGSEIAASASSFLTLGNEVELDISTSPEHRRKGLALHCASAMLRDCMARSITVHWDAQNEASLHLAEKFGFTMEQEYKVFIG